MIDKIAIILGVAVCGLFFMYMREVRKNEQLDISLKQTKAVNEQLVKEIDKTNEALIESEKRKQALSVELEERKANAKTSVRKKDKSWAETPVPDSAVDAISVRNKSGSSSHKKSEHSSDSSKRYSCS